MNQILNDMMRRTFLKSCATFASTLLVPGIANAANLIGQGFTKLNQPRVGININEISDWGTEQPFVDLFKHSRSWVSQRKKAKWGTGPKLELDEAGWVKRMEPNAYATRVVSNTLGLAGRKYVILYDGDGRLKPWGSVRKVLEKAPGRLVIQLGNNVKTLFLDLLSTDPDSYIKNIRIVPLELEATYVNNPWDEGFLRRWSGVACLRMMDLMKTNGSEQKSWTDRPKLNDASFSEKGVPLELLVDLANRLKTDVWFCIPHLADDGYVKNFALYVSRNLDKSVRVWIEYSNEVWNGSFDQAHYAQEQGERLNLDKNRWKASNIFTAKRSLEIFGIWQSVFEGNDRLVRVLAGQSANSRVLKNMLEYKEVANAVDVLAIAPYIGMNVAPEARTKLNASLVSNWTVSEVFDHINNQALPETYRNIDMHMKLARQYKLNLVAYESGQHLVGILGAENDKKLIMLFHKVNADPQMKKVYKQYLAYWAKSGAGLICLYNSMQQWNKRGSFGLLRNRLEDPRKSPKFSAIIEFAKRLGQPMDY